jgi:hypothetical protein
MEDIEVKQLRMDIKYLLQDNENLKQLNTVLHKALTDSQQAYRDLEARLLTVTNDGSK